MLNLNIPLYSFGTSVEDGWKIRLKVDNFCHKIRYYSNGVPVFQI